MPHVFRHSLSFALILFAWFDVRAQQAGTFDEHLKQSQILFKENKLTEALAALQAAGRIDGTRFEAPALAALVLVKAGRVADAKLALADARRLAPSEKQPSLDGIAKIVDAAPAAAAAPVAAPAATPPAQPGQLSGAVRRRYDTLLLIVEEADKTSSGDERRKLLGEFLKASGEFARDQPALVQIWVLRAAAALELNLARIGWDAGREIVKLGAENSDDAKVRKVLAMLDRKGWLGGQPPAPGPASGEKWENSLGMRFVPVPGTNVLFCIWETRVKDFASFVDETRYDPKGVHSWDPDDGTWKLSSGNWRSPGFDQSANHPVVGVSWDDAKTFCRWLTQKDQAAGIISSKHEISSPHGCRVVCRSRGRQISVGQPMAAAHGGRELFRPGSAAQKMANDRELLRRRATDSRSGEIYCEPTRSLRSRGKRVGVVR